MRQALVNRYGAATTSRVLFAMLLIVLALALFLSDAGGATAKLALVFSAGGVLIVLFAELQHYRRLRAK